jgi:hypothetical protein
MLHWRDNSKSTDQMICTHLAVVDFSQKEKSNTNIVTSQNDLFYLMGNLTRKPIWDRRIEFFLVY